MDALIIFSVIVGAGFVSGFYIRDREERKRRKTSKRIDLS